MKHSEKKSFDNYDLAILSSLMREPRITTVELSSAVHLSRTAVARRISILKHKGAFVDVPDLVSYQTLGFDVDATIEIAMPPFNEAASVSEELLAMPEILSVSTTTGRGHLVVRSIALNMEHFRQLIERIRRYGDVTTNIVMSTAKSQLPLSRRLAKIRQLADESSS